MKKYADPAGQELIQLMQNEHDPLEKALESGDLNSVAKILRKVIPIARDIIPHIKVENLQKFIKNAADHAEKVVEKLEAGNGNMSAIDNLMKSESTGLGGILGALVDTVVGLVGKVGGVVNNVLGALG